MRYTPCNGVTETALRLCYARRFEQSWRFMRRACPISKAINVGVMSQNRPQLFLMLTKKRRDPACWRRYG